MSDDRRRWRPDADSDELELELERRAQRLVAAGHDWLTAVAEATRAFEDEARAAGAAPAPHRAPGKLTRTARLKPRAAATIARRHDADDAGDPEHPIVQEALRRRGQGMPLPSDVRREMEARLGVDLGRVRIHVDAVAEQATLAVRARAFTVGEDIFFAAGAFAPGSGAGAELLAHELAHVVQGWQGRVPLASGAVRVSAPGDALEREAEATGRDVTAPGAGRSPPMLVGASTGGLLQRTPEEAAALISRHTSWENLDETGLGRAVLRLATTGQVALADEVLTALGSTDRDDVSYEMMLLATDTQLAALAAGAATRRFLDRVFDELTAGSVSPEEQQQADRVLRVNARQTVGVGAFDAAAGARGTKIFPFRLPGFTVLSDAPVEARRERGGIWCHSFVRVLGTDEFRGETSTLPTEYFLNGITLPENEVIGVRLYDQGGIVHYTTPLFLIQLANATTQQVLEKILEAAGIGLTLGTGALAGLGIEATMAARVLLWADRAAFVLGTVTSVLREHRSWLVEQFGPGFMDAVDIVHSAAAIYGMARLALEAPRMILGLRNGFRAFREAARARSSTLSPSETSTVQQVTRSTEELLEQVDSIQGARPGAPRTSEPPATGDAAPVGPARASEPAATGDAAPETSRTPRREGEEPAGGPREAPAQTRQQRLDELARDPDHAGAITAASRAEAEAAVGLEEAGQLPRPVRRPARGDGHSGDFVDGAGGDWDVKAPRSREAIADRMREGARARGRELTIDPNRALPGEFSLGTMMAEIRGELAAGESVILDTRHLNAADLAALRQGIADAGLAGRVRFYPP